VPGTIGSLVADSSTSTGLKWQAASSSGMTLIANTTLGTAASSVTFSSISGSYQDLMVLITGRTSSTSAALQIEFNTDTASNYYLVGSGRSGTAGESVNLYSSTAKGDMALPNSSTDAKYVGACQIIIPKYAGTTLKKTALFQNAGISGTDLFTRLINVSWDNTAAITEVKLLSSVGNFIAGSSFSLYGLG
jgi:hypothetical protein